MRLLSMRPSRYEGLYVLTVEHEGVRERLTLSDAAYVEAGLPAVGELLDAEAYDIQIGRASCRERVFRPV